MIVGNYKKLDAEKLQPLIDLFLNGDEFLVHKSGTHQQYPLRTLSDGEFWQKHPDLYDYIEKNVYPEDQPILSSFLKLYTPINNQNPNGEFLGLHQDKYYEYPIDEDNLVFATSILLYRSDDAEGGYTILAGDSVNIGKEENRLKDSRDLMSRLLVENPTEPGQMILWNGLTVHGISEMKKGERLNLCVFKKAKFSEDYFKT